VRDAVAAPVPVKQLSPLGRDALVQHFLALAPEDCRLRFGRSMTPDALREYVAALDFDRDALFGAFDDDLRLAGVAHVGRSEEGAELGVSVVPGSRGKGVGSALFERAHAYARNQGLRTLFMHCLTENKAMMHIARKAGMNIVTAAGEAAAHLALPPADAATIAQELLQERVALYDIALKAQLKAARRFAASLRGDGADRG
jgi:RimJ/RimL family protein N-acetyltransferase